MSNEVLGNIISKQLKKIFSERNIQLADFSKKSNLPIDTLKNIYYGKTPDPKISTISIIADTLDMSINCLIGQLSTAEETIINNYRSCGPHGRSIIELIARYEASATRSDRDSLDKHRIPCLVPHGDISNGIIYDTCETIEVETSVNEAYSAIMINNNGLAPNFCKGDMLLFENRFPNNGEYAGFFRDKKAYIRKFVEENGQYRLKCLHAQGEDIVLKRMDQIDYIGTIIDVVRT